MCSLKEKACTLVSNNRKSIFEELIVRDVLVSITKNYLRHYECFLKSKYSKSPKITPTLKPEISKLSIKIKKETFKKCLGPWV